MKILFFDIDGTILYKHRWMPLLVRNAIKKAQSEGNLVFVNTGRSKPTLPKAVLKYIKWDGFVCAGAYIEIHGKPIFDQCFDNEKLHGLVEIADMYNLPVSFDGSERSFFYRDKKPNTVKDSAEIWEKVKTFRVHKVEFRRRLSEEIVKKANVFGECYPMGSYADIFQNGCNKADGIRRVCEYMNVPIENTVAFGDNGNDLAMLTIAGQSVAMHGAPESLRKVATFTAGQKYIGVWQGIKKLVLRKK